MAIRELTKPKRASTRKPKYPFDSKEVEQAVKMLKASKTPGVGPYEGENAIREARSASQSLVRHIVAAEPDLDGRVGTSAWEDENGDAFAIVKLRD
jgi:hypothetical protein